MKLVLLSKGGVTMGPIVTTKKRAGIVAKYIQTSCNILLVNNVSSLTRLGEMPPQSCNKELISRLTIVLETAHYNVEAALTNQIRDAQLGDAKCVNPKGLYPDSYKEMVDDGVVRILPVVTFGSEKVMVILVGNKVLLFKQKDGAHWCHFTPGDTEQRCDVEARLREAICCNQSATPTWTVVEHIKSTVLPNLRDLSTSGAPFLKENALWRSACMHPTCNQSQLNEALDVLEINTVIDLRQEDLAGTVDRFAMREALGTPHTINHPIWTREGTVASPAVNSRVSRGGVLHVIDLMADPKFRRSRVKDGLFSRYGFKLLYLALKDKFFHTKEAEDAYVRLRGANSSIGQLYFELLDNGRDRIKKVLTTVKDAKSGVLIHCEQGRDRTGIIVMLLLSILGASDEMIANDYARSEEERQFDKKFGKRLSRLESLFPEGSFSDSHAIMIELLHRVSEKFGSVNGYLDEIGFGKGDRVALCEKFRQKE